VEWLQLLIDQLTEVDHAATKMTEVTDWEGWFKRREAQQGLYLPEREARFGMMIDILRAIVGDAPTVIDLGCGPGSLALRIADGLPDAHVVAVDADPVGHTNSSCQ
jgi:methylase of polypeptide subunit release factors